MRKTIASLVCAIALTLAFAVQAADPVELKFHTTAGTATITRTAIEKMLDYIDEHSGGGILVTRYLMGEIAQNDEDQISALMEDSIQGICTGDMVLSWAAPEWIGYTSIPFAFKNNDHFFKFFLGEKGEEINLKIQEKFGLRFIDSMIGARGGRMLTANKPIRTPAEMQGAKFRVPNVVGTVASWEGVGANVIGVPWSELFTALQTGLVDSEENPYAELESGAFYQVQSHIMETSHQIGPQLIVVSETFWQSLTPELQQVVNDAVKTGFEWFNLETANNDKRIRDKFIAAGNVIIPREEIDVEAFKKIIEEKVIPRLVKEGKVADGGWAYIQSLAD